MLTALEEPIINRGALDVFHNVNAGSQNANNIERVDVIYPNIIAPAAGLLDDLGFLATEKNGNNDYQIAAILSLDVNGDPASYGSLVYINGINPGTADAYGDFGSFEFSFLENEEVAPRNEPEEYSGNTEPIGYSFVSFNDLGVTSGTTIYGVSFFGRDVNAGTHTLIDPTTFPSNTSEGADIHGGFGSIYVTSNVNLAELTDSDQDGIVDVDDLDDDNDGIPDVEECEDFRISKDDWNTMDDANLLIGVKESFTTSNLSPNVNIDVTVLPAPNANDPSGISGDEYTADGTPFGHFRPTKGVNNKINAADDDKGNTFKMEFTVPTIVKIDNIRHANLVRSENIRVRSASTMRGRLYQSGTPLNPLIATMAGNGTTEVSFVGNGATNAEQRNTVWEVITNEPVMSIEVEYYSTIGGGYSEPWDIYLYDCDLDKDGIENHLDLDSDNDGIPDIVEAGGIDINGDGYVDYPTANDPTSMVDVDGDGLADSIDDQDSGSGGSEVTSGTPLADNDSDGDGFNDRIDLDADNDGIPDLVEIGGVDMDGDGLVDTTTDADGDGYADIYDPDNNGTPGVDPGDDGQPLVETDGSGNLLNGETGVSLDADGDGNPDHLDLDADNDGLPDLVEAGGVDTDGDGLVDNTADADNDGFADIFDTDDDGTLGVEDVTDALLQTAGADTDGDGKADDAAIVFENGENVNSDTDGDGNPDHLDLDTDNDGLPDLVEAGGIDSNGDGLVDVATDADNDGFADIFDTDNNGTLGIDDVTLTLLKTGGTDTDGDGKADDAAITFVDGADISSDFDGDGLPDHLDLDADNDGIPDTVESGAADPENDGKVDIVIAPWDSDNDGLADVYDENNSGTSLIKTSVDSNGDGKVNNGETMIAGGTNNINYDVDAYPNHLDLDADNDGITDVVENGGGDATVDNSTGVLDGIVGDSPTVTDTNTDGWHDPSNSVTTDTDADGIPDYLDIDADNDGIVDYLEGVCSTCPTFVAPSGNDTNGNGVLDMYEVLTSANATGGSNIGSTPNIDNDSGNTTPDYLDTDTDNDGTNDWTEGYDANDNGQAADDLMIMANTYETNTSNNYYINATDTDSDGVPDWMDNQPAVAGYDEATRPPFLDPLSSFWHDDDNDGLVDLFDISEGGTNAPTPDNNGGNDLDWRDFTATVLLPVDLISFDAKADYCDVTLKWTTASEEKFDYFEIQKSGDGHEFTRIGEVVNNGNPDGSTYRFDDNNTFTYNYYRLKMVDIDGSFEYSKIEFIQTDCESDNDISIYPNPVAIVYGILNVSFHAENKATKIKIFDMRGSVVRSLSMEVAKGQNIVEIDISNLPTGTYSLQIVGSKYSKMFNVIE